MSWNCDCGMIAISDHNRVCPRCEVPRDREWEATRELLHLDGQTKIEIAAKAIGGDFVVKQFLPTVLGSPNKDNSDEQTVRMSLFLEDLLNGSGWEEIKIRKERVG